jgi:Beta-1,4-xylanase
MSHERVSLVLALWRLQAWRTLTRRRASFNVYEAITAILQAERDYTSMDRKSFPFGQISRRRFIQTAAATGGAAALGGGLLTNQTPVAHASTTYPYSILPANVLPTFTIKGAPTSAIQIVPVSGQSFSEALEVTTPADIAISPYLEGEYQITVAAVTNQPVTQGDTLVATFWLRAVAPTDGTAFTKFLFEQNGGSYTKSFTYPLPLSQDWTQYQFAFQLVGSYASGLAHITFWIGYGAQTFDIGAVSVMDMGPGVPTPYTYDGRDPNASWRASAQARIDRYRKGNFSVTVHDLSGQPILNATVRLKMLKHAFSFGAASSVPSTLLDTTINGQNCRTIETNQFTKVVLANELKWSSSRWPNANATLTQTLPTIAWLRQNSVAVRGHNLLWPFWAAMPGDVQELSTDLQALSHRLDNHLLNEVSMLRGQTADWDVVNEPYADHVLQDLLDPTAMAHWFQVAHQADPHVPLALNDYNLLEGLGVEKRQQNFMYNLIQSLQAQGAPISLLGLESHFRGYSLTSPDTVLSILDRFAGLGLTLQITEFDINTNDAQLQADYTRDFLTVAFSHPHVKSFLNWGFWQGEDSTPNGALYNQDWSIKPNGQAWKDLVFNQWWTDASGQSDNAGQYSARGFLGDYEVDVTVNGTTNIVYTSLPQRGKNLMVTFDPNAQNPPPPPTKPLPLPAPVPPPAIPLRSNDALINGDCELGTAGWITYGPCALSSSSTAHSGTKALLVTNRGGYRYGPAQDLISTARKGLTYHSSVWVKLAPGSASTTAVAELRVNARDTYQQVLPLGSATVTDSQWTQITGSALLAWRSAAPDNLDWVVYTADEHNVPNFLIDDAQMTTTLPPKTVVVQHAPQVNGSIQGSVQVLNGEDILFNGSAAISGGLYVPGTPAFHIDSLAVAPFEMPSIGLLEPNNYTILFKGAAQILWAITRTDPVHLPVVNVPPTPTGTADVVIRLAGQTISDFSTLRNLTLLSDVGTFAVPPGTYGAFTVHSGSTLSLGVANTPVVYNLQSLALNVGSTLNVVGPVTLNLAGDAYISGTAGAASSPFWLTLNVANGNVTVASQVSVYGVVNNPGKTVTLNRGAQLRGQIFANNLTVSPGATVQDVSGS